MGTGETEVKIEERREASTEEHLEENTEEIEETECGNTEEMIVVTEVPEVYFNLPNKLLLILR